MLKLNPALMSFNGKRFNSVELDGEFWIRADELGLAIGLEQPEQSVLQLYQDNPDQFSERLTALVGVETAEGPRLMRVFNLLGAYVLCTFVDTYAARTVRRWLLETIIYFQMDVKREIRRLIEELRLQREMIDALRADVDALKAAMRDLEAKDSGEVKPEWFEGEFRRLFEEQMVTFRDTLAAIIREHLARLPASGAERQGMESLAEAIAGLYERIDGAVPNDRVPTVIPSRSDAEGMSVPAAPSVHWLHFSYEGQPLAVLLENGCGPWFVAAEIYTILGTPGARDPMSEEEMDARIGPGNWRSLSSGNGKTFDIVNETGLGNVLDQALCACADRDRLIQWLKESLIPSVEMLILREDETLRIKDEPGFQPPPSPPRRLMADGLFPVYTGKISGRTCMMVNARDMYKYLEIRKPFVDWLPDWLKRLGANDGICYLRILVNSRYYDYYLDLDTALGLLFHESYPKAREAYDFLISVITPHRGIIEGEAEVVEKRAASPEGGLVQVPFRGATLFVVDRDGEPWVPMKPVTEGMGLDWEGQRQRILRDEILSKGVFIMKAPSVGGEQEMIALPLKLLNGWLFGIEASRAKSKIREDILAYRQELPELLERHWQRHRKGASPEGTLVPVPFHKQSLPSFQRDGEIYVAMKPIAEAMGLQWEAQHKRIRRNEILSSTMSMMDIVAADGKRREVVALPLKLLNGWLFGIDANRVKPEIKETILTYQRESYDVLYRYWHGLEQTQHQSAKPTHAQRPTHLADTTPGIPLRFDFEDKHLRVAIQGGQAWFYAQDLHLASPTQYEPSHCGYEEVPKQWRRLVPGAGGEGNVQVLSVEGMAHYFGLNPKTHGNPLLDFVLEEVLPSLQERIGNVSMPQQADGRQAQAKLTVPQALPPVPPEKFHSASDTLYVVFTDLMQRRLKANRKRLAILNCSMLLTHLWRNGGDGQWLDVRKPGKLTLSKTLGISPRSLGRSLDYLVANGFVERTPALDSRCPEIWPHNIRLQPGNLLAALAEAGLEPPEEPRAIH